MNVLSFDDFAGLGLRSFNAFGWKSPTGRSLFRPISFWIQFLSICMGFLMISIFLYYNLGHRDNLRVQTHDMMSLMIQAMIIGKMFFMLFLHHAKLKYMFEKLRVMFPKNREDQEKYQVEATRKTMNIRNWIFLGILASNTLFFNLMPLLSAIMRILFGDGVYQLELPFHFWTPFDQKRRFVQEAFYVFAVWCNFTNFTVTFTTDILYGTVLTGLNIQFRILGKRISELDLKSPPKLLKRKMVAIIENHNELILLSDLAEEAFTSSVLVCFVTGTLILCLAGFQLMVSFICC